MRRIGLVMMVVVGLGLRGAARAQSDAMPPETMAGDHAPKAATPSMTLAVSVDGKTTSLTAADLQAMPQKTIAVHNAHSNADETYSGVALGDLLAKYGVTAAGTGAKRVYHSYVRAEGTDHYWVIYSASEVEGAVHKGDVIVAISRDGKPLGEDGMFKLVASEEQKPARWVRNLQALTLVTVE